MSRLFGSCLRCVAVARHREAVQVDKLEYFAGATLSRDP